MLDLDINVNYQTMHGQYLVINLHGDRCELSNYAWAVSSDKYGVGSFWRTL